MALREADGQRLMGDYLDYIAGASLEARDTGRRVGLPDAIHVREFVQEILLSATEASRAELELALRWVLYSPESEFNRLRKL